MELKIGKDKLYDWENWLNYWVRPIYIEPMIKSQPKKGYYAISGPIATTQCVLHKIQSRFKDRYAWYPQFNNQLQLLQQIYDKSTNFQEFEINEIEQAKIFVDNFLEKYLNRINKLLCF